MADITDMQQRFVDEYLIDLNATRAAIRAGYSPKTADQQGSRLLKIVKVQTAIAEAQALRSRRTGISQDRVLQELAKIAFVNPVDVLDLDQARALKDATRDDLACIQSVKYKRSDSDTGSSEERQVVLADKLKALELLGKHLGMFKDRLEITGLEEEKTKLDSILLQMRGEDG